MQQWAEYGVAFTFTNQALRFQHFVRLFYIAKIIAKDGTSYVYQMRSAHIKYPFFLK